MNQKKTKHQKRLEEIRSKKIRRTIRFQLQPFSGWDFIRTYQLELLVGVIVICIFVFIPRWDSWMSQQEKKSSESSISEEMKQQLLGKYPNGFKLLEVRNWGLRSLDDTLSSDFQLNWEGAQLIQFSGGKIRIKLPHAYHDPSQGILKNLIVDFERHHHEMIRINQLTTFNLLAEIIEDDGDKVVCLFSFELTEKTK